MARPAPDAGGRRWAVGDSVAPGLPPIAYRLSPRSTGVRAPLARLRRGSTVVLLAIMALAAALRLLHLASNPGWDGDEGYNYNIAFNLAHGHHQMFALDFAFGQHPPLVFALAAGLFRLLGPTMLALRLLSVAFCPALARLAPFR